MNKILIVDDETDILMEVAECLEFEGFSTLTAGSGEEALEIMRSQDGIKVLVTDLKMPKMDGAELITAATEEGLLDGSLIVLISGHLSHELVDRTVYDFVLKKPIDVDMLVKLINQADEG